MKYKGENGLSKESGLEMRYLNRRCMASIVIYLDERLYDMVTRYSYLDTDEISRQCDRL